MNPCSVRTPPGEKPQRPAPARGGVYHRRVATYSRTIEVPCPRAEAFDAVADFSSAERWDPGIARSTRTSDGPVGVGSTFDILARFRGRELPFTYTVVDLVPGERVVIRGEGRSATALDTVTFADADGGGTRLTYTAELGMKGLLKLAEPFMGGAFRQMGDAAIDGLRDWLTARCTGGG